MGGLGVLQDAVADEEGGGLEVLQAAGVALGARAVSLYGAGKGAHAEGLGNVFLRGRGGEETVGGLGLREECEEGVIGRVFVVGQWRGGYDAELPVGDRERHAEVAHQTDEDGGVALGHLLLTGSNARTDAFIGTSGDEDGGTGLGCGVEFYERNVGRAGIERVSAAKEEKAVDFGGGDGVGYEAVTVVVRMEEAGVERGVGMGEKALESVEVVGADEDVAEEVAACLSRSEGTG